MTQFLFVRPEPASLPEGFVAKFREDSSGWQIVPEAGELDSVCDQARTALLGGAPMQRARLGELLLSLIDSRCDFAMFWASDSADLPEPATADALLQLVADQLTTADGSWEVYVRWRAATR